eukprot:6760823-Alexandrium_andersonii.AAC.1
MAAGVWAASPIHVGHMDLEVLQRCIGGPHAEGYSFWAPLRGPTPSTARAEGCASLLAARVGVPINVGVGNSSVVGRAKRVIVGPRPWAKPRGL